MMVDIETLGTQPGSIILSIGAVFFTPHELGPEFYEIITKKSCEDVGCTIDQDALDWWKKRSAEARAIFSSEKAKPLGDVLDLFLSFIKSNSDPKKVRIWGDGSDFDNVLIISALRKCKKNPSWRYWNHRCYRTLKSLYPSIRPPWTVVKHNSLNDAKSQAEHTQKLLLALNGGRPCL